MSWQHTVKTAAQSELRFSLSFGEPIYVRRTSARFDRPQAAKSYARPAFKRKPDQNRETHLSRSPEIHSSTSTPLDLMRSVWSLLYGGNCALPAKLRPVSRPATALSTTTTRSSPNHVG